MVRGCVRVQARTRVNAKSMASASLLSTEFKQPPTTEMKPPTNDHQQLKWKLWNNENIHQQFSTDFHVRIGTTDLYSINLINSGRNDLTLLKDPVMISAVDSGRNIQWRWVKVAASIILSVILCWLAILSSPTFQTFLLFAVAKRPSCYIYWSSFFWI